MPQGEQFIAIYYGVCFPDVFNIFVTSTTKITKIYDLSCIMAHVLSEDVLLCQGVSRLASIVEFSQAAH